VTVRQPKSYWIERLGLHAHPEGGHFIETFRSARQIIAQDDHSPRDLSTAIYYLLGSTALGEFSAWHRLDGLEESWYHHCGDTLSIYQIDEAGKLAKHRLGLDPDAQLQVHIPADTWFCAAVENTAPEAYALVSCTVQPGFEYHDFDLAQRDVLAARFPAHQDIIQRYCR